MGEDGHKVPGLSFPDSVEPETMDVRGWQLSGSAQVTSSETVVLTEDKQNEVGTLWSKNRAMQLSGNWDMEFKFRVVGEHEVHGDGFAMWLTEKPMGESVADSEAFGHDPSYKGLGIFFDTFRNNDQNKRPFPLVLAKFSDRDDTKSYGHDSDGLPPELWTFMSQRRSKSYANFIAVCAADYRFREGHHTGDTVSILQLSHRRGTLIVTVGTPPMHDHLQPKWKQCGILKQINFDNPDGYYLGFSGMTGEVTNRQEIVDVSFYAVSEASAQHFAVPPDVEEAREVFENPEEPEVVDEELVIKEGKLQSVVGEELAELAAKVEDATVQLAQEILKEKVQDHVQDQMDREQVAKALAEDLVAQELKEETEKLLNILEGKEEPQEGVAAEVAQEMNDPEARKEEVQHILEEKQHKIEDLAEEAKVQNEEAGQKEQEIDPQLLKDMEEAALEEIAKLKQLEAMVEEHEDTHVYEVSIPEGIEEGMEFQVSVSLDDGTKVLVDLTCPAGLVAGDFMRFRVPEVEKLEEVAPHLLESALKEKDNSAVEQAQDQDILAKQENADRELEAQQAQEVQQQETNQNQKESLAQQEQENPDANISNEPVEELQKEPEVGAVEEMIKDDIAMDIHKEPEVGAVEDMIIDDIAMDAEKMVNAEQKEVLEKINKQIKEERMRKDALNDKMMQEQMPNQDEEKMRKKEAMMQKKGENEGELGLEDLTDMYHLLQENQNLIGELDAFKDLFDQYAESNEALKLSSDNLNKITNRIEKKIEDFFQFANKFDQESLETIAKIEQSVHLKIDSAFDAELHKWQVPLICLGIFFLCAMSFTFQRLCKIENYKGGLL